MRNDLLASVVERHSELLGFFERLSASPASYLSQTSAFIEKLQVEK